MSRALSSEQQHVESFNRNIKLLTRDLAGRFPNDALIQRAVKRVMTAIHIEPCFVMKEVGGYLLKYREAVYDLNGDGETFFLENTFDQDLKSSIDKEKADITAYIIPKAKECMRSLPSDEMQEYKGLVMSLLDDYIDYLLACKK